MILHGYYCSSAAYRVRIALNLKGVTTEQVPHHLRKGKQRDPRYLEDRPAGPGTGARDRCGRRPHAVSRHHRWLEETRPEPPLLPTDPMMRSRVRAFAYAVACDTHPVQNLKVLNRLRELGVTEDEVTAWARWVNEEGLRACEALIADQAGPFCFGGRPTLADICLVPQLYNARHFGVDLAALPRILDADRACLDLSAFADAAPERQPDAE